MAARIDPAQTDAYHITDIANLRGIIQGGLQSDALMRGAGYTHIGYDHIKERRLTSIRVTSVPGLPFVGQFVPFYYCPRSVMLFVVNQGNTGHPVGCQSTIVHLVFRVTDLSVLGPPWAISDGNAGAYSALFYSELSALGQLDWAAIRATSWKGLSHQKQAEFLVMDRVPWESVVYIGCYDQAAVDSALKEIRASGSAHVPCIGVKREWYY